jgi:hypothetical protein
MRPSTASRILRGYLIALAIAGTVAVSASADAGAPRELAPADEQNHKLLMHQLSVEQIAALNAAYPGFRVLKFCSGRFSGADRDELVLGLWKPVDSKQWWKREVHRVGLIWTPKAWEVHVIDDEIEDDKNLSRSFPMNWAFSLTSAGFAAEMKCGIDGEFSEHSQLTHSLGDKPFLDLYEAGLNKNKVVCFATSDTYNNWDCLVFSSKDRRFRLWYQQAHAD